MANKISLFEIRKLELEHQEIIDKEYEKISKEMVGKLYVNKWVDQWKDERTDYFFIHTNKGRQISGIEFNLGNLSMSRVGHSLSYFENWEEVKSDKVMDIKFELTKFFHLGEIFKGYL